MLLLLFILSTIYAGEEIFFPVTGIIINENRKPIENVSVLIDSLNIGTTTDKSGYFSIMLETGSYDITFYHIGYENSNIKLTSPTRGTIKFILNTSPIKTDELVITSNRKETYIKDTPIITHVITKNDINKSSYSTVKELIEFAMPSIQSTHDNHGEDKIKIQGLDNKYTTFLVDGNKVTGEFAGNIDFSQFNINNIEKIEVVRGGLSTVYGSGAMGGVVNIITKNNPNSIWISYNSFYDMPKIFSNSLGFGIGYKNIRYSSNINYSTTNGYDLTPNNFNEGSNYTLINKTLDEYSSILIDQKVKFDIDKKSAINFRYKYYIKNIYKYQFSDNDNVTYLYDELPVFENKTISLNYKRILNKNSMITFSYQNEDYSKSFYFPYYYGNDSSYNLNGETILWSSPNTSTSSILYNTKLNTHELLFGVDYIYQTYSSANIFAANGNSIKIESIFGEDATKNMSETAIFILDNFKYNDIEFNLGARVNHHSKYKTRVSPSISLMKAINNYNYRFNFSQNYRIPSLKEMYYNYEDHGAGFPIIGNEDLNPSISNYYSISIESRKYINNSIELYYNNLSDMIVNRFVIDENNSLVYQYHNYKDVDLYGFNISIMVASIDKINLNSVYSFTEAQSNYKEATDGISSHSINFKLRYNPFKTLDILFSSRFNSSKTVDTSLPDENDNRNELILPAYSTSDLSITKSFKDKNYLKVGVKNIFNYIDTNEPPAMPDFLASYEAGRRFFISINFQLSRKL